MFNFLTYRYGIFTLVSLNIKGPSVILLCSKNQLSLRLFQGPLCSRAPSAHWISPGWARLSYPLKAHHIWKAQAEESVDETQTWRRQQNTNWQDFQEKVRVKAKVATRLDHDAFFVTTSNQLSAEMSFFFFISFIFIESKKKLMKNQMSKLWSLLRRSSDGVEQVFFFSLFETSLARHVWLKIMPWMKEEMLLHVEVRKSLKKMIKLFSKDRCTEVAGRKDVAFAEHLEKGRKPCWWAWESNCPRGKVRLYITETRSYKSCWRSGSSGLR